VARRLLDAGHAVIADGVYGQPDQRAGIEAVADAAEVPFTGSWLTAPEAVMERRVEGRTGDASDADARVIRLQRAIDDSAIGWERIRADRTLDAVAADALALWPQADAAVAG